MKKVYLDNNIMVELEQGTITLSSLLETLNIDTAEIYFSAAHLREAFEIKADSAEQRLERLRIRFDTISTATNNNYLNADITDQKIYSTQSTPLDVYETINSPSSDGLIKSFINLTSEEHKAVFRDSIGIDMKRINNYTAEEVLDQLSKKQTALNNMSMFELIESSINLYPNSNEMGDYNRFVGVFEFIDLLGYWKDKKSTKSNYARFNDATHCFYASHCDVLVSNDKRMRNKSKVMYALLGIDTLIVNQNNEFV